MSNTVLSLSTELFHTIVAFMLLAVSFISKRTILASLGGLTATFIFLYLLATTLNIVYAICIIFSLAVMAYFAFETLGGD